MLYTKTPNLKYAQHDQPATTSIALNPCFRVSLISVYPHSSCFWLINYFSTPISILASLNLSMLPKRTCLCIFRNSQQEGRAQRVSADKKYTSAYSLGGLLS
jgi:hypothetical protein